MKERGMILRDWEVRAVLDGTKTQLRRAVKNVPSWVTSFGYSVFTPDGCISGRGVYPEHGPAEKIYKLPFGRPGDRIWVRESFSVGVDAHIWYWADGNPDFGDWTKPRSSTQMPRWASRITLEITDVRVRRVQKISKEDAIAEGPPSWVDGRALIDPPPGLAVESFAAIWDADNAKRGFGWDTNPWIWAITFKRVTT